MQLSSLPVKFTSSRQKSATTAPSSTQSTPSKVQDPPTARSGDARVADMASAGAPALPLHWGGGGERRAGLGSALHCAAPARPPTACPRQGATPVEQISRTARNRRLAPVLGQHARSSKTSRATKCRVATTHQGFVGAFSLPVQGFDYMGGGDLAAVSLFCGCRRRSLVATLAKNVASHAHVCDRPGIHARAPVIETAAMGHAWAGQVYDL